MVVRVSAMILRGCRTDARTRTTRNKMLDGFRGAPVGMTRIFHYAGFAQVAAGYFSYRG